MPRDCISSKYQKRADIRKENQILEQELKAAQEEINF
jgi:hypothetical protein